MKGIILAGGSGTRLWPLTKAVSKQLMPVFDKPMIYYPISTLMLAGIREILIITTPEDSTAFKRLLGDGSALGCTFEYAVQEVPNGLAQAFVIGEEFIGESSVALILGDNIFHGNHFGRTMRANTSIEDDEGEALSLEEKPSEPSSNFAIPGLYFYDNKVIDIAKKLTPSKRGEYEITDVNKAYLKLGALKVSKLGRTMAWLDTGTHESLHAASQYVKVIEQRQGLKIGSIEEVAWRMGYITDDDLRALAKPLCKSGYGDYLLAQLAKKDR